MGVICLLRSMMMVINISREMSIWVMMMRVTVMFFGVLDLEVLCLLLVSFECSVGRSITCWLLQNYDIKKDSLFDRTGKLTNVEAE
jgi:hypothetical protein